LTIIGGLRSIQEYGEFTTKIFELIAETDGNNLVEGPSLEQFDAVFAFDPEMMLIVTNMATMDIEDFKMAFKLAWTRLMNIDRFDGPIGNVCDKEGKMVMEPTFESLIEKTFGFKISYPYQKNGGYYDRYSYGYRGEMDALRAELDTLKGSSKTAQYVAAGSVMLLIIGASVALYRTKSVGDERESEERPLLHVAA